MDLCSLEDAFPDILQKEETGSGAPKPGCSDAKASREERRAARRKAKKCKIPAADHWAIQDGEDLPARPDPDRPAVKRMGEVPAFVSLSEAFPDLSGDFVEGFRPPTMPSSSCLFSDQGLPAYFGKGIEDTEEGFTDVIGQVGQALQNLKNGFEKKGVEKAGSEDILPDPPLVDAWKPITPAKATTAYFNSLPEPKDGKGDIPGVKDFPPMVKTRPPPPAEPSPIPPQDRNSETDPPKDSVLLRLREMSKRIDELERTTNRNSQKEVLLFVGTGVFLLVTFDLLLRSTRG